MVTIYIRFTLAAVQTTKKASAHIVKHARIPHTHAHTHAEEM